MVSIFPLWAISPGLWLLILIVLTRLFKTNKKTNIKPENDVTEAGLKFTMKPELELWILLLLLLEYWILGLPDEPPRVVSHFYPISSLFAPFSASLSLYVFLLSYFLPSLLLQSPKSGSKHSDTLCLPFCLQLLYTGKVREDVTPGHFILKVSAIDVDMDTNAQITYSLHGPGAQEFKLDPHTGKSLWDVGWSQEPVPVPWWALPWNRNLLIHLSTH